MDLTIRLARHVARSISTYDDKEQNDAEFESTDSNRLIGTLAVLPLGATAFVFKLAFTARDAPELTGGVSEGLIAWVGTLELVGLARMIFGGLGLTASWIIFAERKRSKDPRAAKHSNGSKLTWHTVSILICNLRMIANGVYISSRSRPL